jgi:hypothetical protein
VLDVLIRTYGPGVVLVLIIFAILVVAFVYLAARNEALAMRIAAPFARSFSWASKWLEYKAVEWDVEGRINAYAAKLAAQTPGADIVAVDLEFIKDGKPPEAFYRDGDLIIRMQDSGHKDENLMRAAEMYVSEILLPRSKAHMSGPQQRSLDLFVTEDLLKEESPAAHTMYTSKVLAPAIASSDRIGGLLKDYDLIHYAGYFYPILLQELAFLSEQRVTRKDLNEFRSEVYNLIEFFGALARREEGSDTGGLSFLGHYSRCNITIVAKAEKAEQGLIGPWMKWLKSNAGRFDTVYLIARTRHVDLMEAVAAEAESAGIYKVFGTRSYRARTRRNDRWIVREATVTVLRNPQSIAKYMPHIVVDDTASTPLPSEALYPAD